VSRQRTIHSAGTVVLDCEGLSKWCKEDPRVVRLIREAQNNDVRVVVSAMTTIEACDVRTRDERFSWYLSRLKIMPVTEEIAKQAMNLLRVAGLHGHKYAIDAVVAATALTVVEPVAIFTSDVDDMRKLCGKAVELLTV
jgi:predicted nucleic acid-binding protein